MNIWVVSMECAGICEAGGVKNVTYSLSEELAKANNQVTVFLPVFKCTDFISIKNYKKIDSSPVSVDICNKKEEISFYTGQIKKTKINVVFIFHQCFLEKDEIYVYSQNEENQNPQHKKGTGHQDMNFLDTIFQKAVCAYGSLVSKENLPDVIHCHDASTAGLPAYINLNKDLYKKTKSFVTIHNAGPAYHHEYPDFNTAKYYSMLPDEILGNASNNGKIEQYLIGGQFAKLLTVSEQYAEELMDSKNNEETDGLSGCFVEKNMKVEGITNGIDQNRYNPVFKNRSFLPFSYNPSSGRLSGKYKCRQFLFELCKKSFRGDNYLSFISEIDRYGYLDTEKDQEYILLSFHGRIVRQKGISILLKAAERLFSVYDKLRIVVAGKGNSEEELELMEFVSKYPGKIVFFNGYNKRTVRLSVAASDYIILPSEFEPCCLEDFIAQIFGTLPVAHATGGLKKIIDDKTGFLYYKNTPETLEDKIKYVITTYYSNKAKSKKMIKYTARYIKKNYSWKKVSKLYYKKFLENF